MLILDSDVGWQQNLILNSLSIYYKLPSNTQQNPLRLEVVLDLLHQQLYQTTQYIISNYSIVFITIHNIVDSLCDAGLDQSIIMSYQRMSYVPLIEFQIINQRIGNIEICIIYDEVKLIRDLILILTSVPLFKRFDYSMYLELDILVLGTCDIL